MPASRPGCSSTGSGWVLIGFLPVPWLRTMAAARRRRRRKKKRPGCCHRNRPLINDVDVQNDWNETADTGLVGERNCFCRSRPTTDGRKNGPKQSADTKRTSSKSQLCTMKNSVNSEPAIEEQPRRRMKRAKPFASRGIIVAKVFLLSLCLSLSLSLPRRWLFPFG